jgi:hypothetical protein
VYKDRLVQRGRNEAIKDFVLCKITSAFTSNDPNMVEVRSQMFRQAGVELP